MPPAWQKCTEHWQVCHSWLNLAMHRFTAMMMFLILLVAAVVFAMIAAVVELRRDGFRRLPDRRFGPAGSGSSDVLGRSLMAGMR
ncbi:MAG: hypothetical protein JWP90_2507 [Mycetocola sp.]|jgi:hypothetical protein|nr:hypothetical protein [Mycetocola sp.]